MPSTLIGGTGKKRKGERKQALKLETRSQAEADSQPDFKNPWFWRCLDTENTDILRHCNSCNSGEFAKKKKKQYAIATQKTLTIFVWLIDFAGVFREFFYGLEMQWLFHFCFISVFLNIRNSFDCTNGYKGTQQPLLVAASIPVTKWNHFSMETPKGSLSFVPWQNESSTFTFSTSQRHSLNHITQQHFPTCKALLPSRWGRDGSKHTMLCNDKDQKEQLILRSSLLNPFLGSLSRFVGNTILGSPLQVGWG